MPASTPLPQAGEITSPKVPAATKGSAWVGLGITILGVIVAAVVTVVTPETLTPLVGPVWAIPLVSAVQAAGSAFAAWKRGYAVADPLRDMTPTLTPTVFVGPATPQGVADGDPAAETAVPDGTGTHRADPA